MPFIDSKITVPVTPQVKEEIKSALGRMITTLHKSEYVAVSLYGSAAAQDYDRLTGQICQLYSDKLGIPGSAIYVTYHPVNDWGWNGANF